jgi:hypothetical protein
MSLPWLVLTSAFANPKSRRMTSDNINRGAPRIHGELLNLGFTVSDATVSRYVPHSRPKPPSQTWCTFLRNHKHCAVGIDFFVVPIPATLGRVL